jgi:hypothetical protein
MSFKSIAQQAPLVEKDQAAYITAKTTFFIT